MEDRAIAAILTIWGMVGTSWLTMDHMASIIASVCAAIASITLALYLRAKTRQIYKNMDGEK